jgi:hypothetical protein
MSIRKHAEAIQRAADEFLTATCRDLSLLNRAMELRNEINLGSKKADTAEHLLLELNSLVHAVDVFHLEIPFGIFPVSLDAHKRILRLYPRSQISHLTITNTAFPGTSAYEIRSFIDFLVEMYRGIPHLTVKSGRVFDSAFLSFLERLQPRCLEFNPRSLIEDHIDENKRLLGSNWMQKVILLISTTFPEYLHETLSKNAGLKVN